MINKVRISLVALFVSIVFSVGFASSVKAQTCSGTWKCTQPILSSGSCSGNCNDTIVVSNGSCTGAASQLACTSTTTNCACGCYTNFTGCSWGGGSGPTATPTPATCVCNSWNPISSCGNNCPNANERKYNCTSSTPSGCAVADQCFVAAECGGGPTNTPGPTSPPAPGNGTYQGFKLMMPSNTGISPAKDQIVSVPGASSAFLNPYFINASAGSHPVSITVPNGGYGVGYTSCRSDTDPQCGAANDPRGYHVTNPTPGSTANVVVPGGGINDLWWHFYNPPSATIAGPVVACSGQPTNYTLTASATDYIQSQILSSPTSSQNWTIHYTGYVNPPSAVIPVTFSSNGTYYLVTNAYGSHNGRCSGNPFGLPLDWGDCGSSDTLTVTVSSPPIAPTLNVITQTSACNAGVSLSWSPVGGASSYKVYKNGVFLKSVVGTSTTDATAACGTSPNYQVSAVTACEGPLSPIRGAPVVVCTPPVPAIPTASTGQTMNITVGNLTSGYAVWANTTNIGSPTRSVGTATGPTLNDSAALCAVGTNYYYQAWATSGTCTSKSNYSSAGNCLPNPNWFQSSGGDVTANGSINNSQMPASQITVGIIAGTTINWGSNAANQLVQSAIHASVINNNNFNALYNAAVVKAGANMRVNPSVATTSISELNTAGVGCQANLVGGVCYVEFNGPSLTFTAGTLARNYVVIYSGSGDVYLNGNIAVNPAFANTFVLLAKNNIYVDSAVGVASDPSLVGHGDNLQGIYVAGGTFYDKTAASDGGRTLRINGSVIGLGGVSLGRQPVGTYSKDYFLFNPGYVMNMPSGLKLSNKVFSETAP